MSLPSLLLVDDSDAVLAYEKAALGSLYQCTTAVDGAEALELVRRQLFAAVLLDLSMPKVSGDRVLEAMRSDEKLASVPVIIISSEQSRAEACLTRGAQAYLGKPLRAEALRATVARVLDEAAAKDRARTFVALPLALGHVELGVPLEAVQAVELMPRTRRLDAGPARVTEVVDYHGQVVPVLDLAAVLRTKHERPITERKLILVRSEARLIAMAVDSVEDPQELPPTSVIPRAQFGADPKLLGRSLIAIARTGRGLLPIVDPASFYSRALLRSLSERLRLANAVNPG